MVRVLPVLVLVMLTSAAWADVISNEEASCRGKSAGDPCEAGACVLETCSRSRPGPDGKPVTTSWPCVMCRAGASAEGDTLRLVIGLLVAAGVIGGGVWLARKRMKQGAL